MCKFESQEMETTFEAEGKEGMIKSRHRFLLSSCSQKHLLHR